MTPATVFVSKPAKRARPWSSWTTMSPVRRSANERSAPRPVPRPAAACVWRRAWMSRCSGMTASWNCGAMKPSRSRASTKRSAPAAVAPPTAPSGGRGCRRRARPCRGLRPGDDRRVARERVSFSSSGSAAASERAATSAACARNSSGWLGVQARTAGSAARGVERGRIALGLDVEVVRRPSSWKAAQTSCQWSRSAGSRSSSAATITCARRPGSGRAARGSGRRAAARRCRAARPRRRHLGQLAVLERRARRRARSRSTPSRRGCAA